MGVHSGVILVYLFILSELKLSALLNLGNSTLLTGFWWRWNEKTCKIGYLVHSKFSLNGDSQMFLYFVTQFLRLVSVAGNKQFPVYQAGSTKYLLESSEVKAIKDFIHSFYKCLLNTCYIPGTWDSTEWTTQTNPSPHGACTLAGGNNQQKHGK